MEKRRVTYPQPGLRLFLTFPLQSLAIFLVTYFSVSYPAEWYLLFAFDWLAGQGGGGGGGASIRQSSAVHVLVWSPLLWLSVGVQLLIQTTALPLTSSLVSSLFQVMIMIFTLPANIIWSAYVPKMTMKGPTNMLPHTCTALLFYSYCFISLMID